MKVWLSNTHDPKDPNVDMYVVRGFGETQAEAVRHHSEWLKDKTIGKPRAARGKTVKQTEEMGLVGVYAEMSVWKWIGRLLRGWW